ncbi:hypothetical protein [Symbiobacterium thermophilum]|uniref:hypothetical protein n=1 Tax=Symbiobacterium thermophilum TaxID=2734 RepID=UPI0002E1CF9E|nr:hypothetical protein [Symbiobacterium thermophilum]
MTSTTESRRSAASGTLTYGTILRLFLPLSLSDVIMVIAGPILTIGLTKLANPEISLAAYAVANNVAILLESPIIMLLHASNLLSRYRETYQPLRHFMLWANALLTALYALLAFTPAYDLIFRTLLGQPDAIAAAARPAFQVQLLWPAAIGWRRFYQGILIQHKRSSVVAYAGFARIGSLALVTALGVMGRAHGATLAGLALVVSVIVEAAAVTWLARPVLQAGVTDPHAEAPDWAPRTVGQIALWYWPLAMTQILVSVVRPLLSGGIARSVDPELGLAAWPVAWSTILMVANAVRMVQQVALTLLQDRRSYLMLRRFTLTIGAVACCVMALLAVTPLGRGYMEWVLGLKGGLASVADAALPALGFGVVFPFYVALQNWLQALLIKDGRTLVVNAGAIAGGAVTLAAVYAGALIWRLPGAVLGIVSLLCGAAVELVVLVRASRPQRQAWLAR